MINQFGMTAWLVALTASQIFGASGANDDFADAANLGNAVPVHRACDPRIASFEDGEDQGRSSFERNIIGGSLWFRWTAPSNGIFRVVGLSGNELLRVYSGTTLTDLTEVSLETGFSSSASSFAANAGEERFLQITFQEETFSYEESIGNTLGFILEEIAQSQTYTAVGDGPVLKSFYQFEQSTFDEARVSWTPPATGPYLIQSDQGFAVEIDGVVTNHDSSEPLSVAINSLAEVEISTPFSGFSEFQTIVVVAEAPSQNLGSVQSGEFYTLSSSTSSSSTFTWTAPGDGYVIFEVNSNTPDGAVDFYDLDFNDFEFVEAGTFDCETLTRSGSGFAAVTGGTVYEMNPFAFSFESSALLVGSFRFFSTPSTVEEHLILASVQLDSDLTESSLLQVNASLDAALALEPTHPTANFMKALVHLFLLGQTTDFQQLLTSVGITPDTADFTETDFTIPSAEDGLPNFPADAEATGRLAAVENVISSRLAEMRAFLVTAQTSTVDGSALELDLGNFSFDEADYLGFIAFVDMFDAFLDLITIYDLGGSLNAIVQLERDGSLDFETALNEFPNLLSVANSSAVDDFKEKMNQANTVLCAALVKASAERTDCGAHFFPPEGLLGEVDLFELTETVDNVLAGPFDAGGVVVDLTQYTGSQLSSLRDQLPTIRNGRAVAFSVPDPSFGGLIAGADQVDFVELFAATDVLLEPAQYAQWILGFIDNGLPSFLAEMEDDADSDGDTNLEEYFFGSDPNDPSLMVESPLTELITLSGGEGLGVTFIRRQESEEVNYVLATSEDLIEWEFSQAEVSMVGTATSLGGGRELVTFAIPLDALKQKRFIQIHAAAQ